MARWLHVVVLVTTLGSSIGCSKHGADMPELGTVRGAITLDGKPLDGVSIYFKPDVGRQSIAKADADGNYEAYYLIDEPGVKVGPCSVTVEWAPDDSGPAIPAKYGYKSELTFDVKSGENTFDIEMKSE
ncbi:MAG: carboxypeptidase regulatory-like domain-containing protein [Pirellulaceae bacterium]